MGSTKKRGGRSKLTRSETVTVRLDPKLRFALELAARKHRRTVSSFIEWAVESSLRDVTVRDVAGSEATVQSVVSDCWDVDEADRVIRLAIWYPELVNHEEAAAWKVVLTQPTFWLDRKPGVRTRSRTATGMRTLYDETKLEWPLIRRYWSNIKRLAREEITVDRLFDEPDETES